MKLNTLQFAMPCTYTHTHTLAREWDLQTIRGKSWCHVVATRNSRRRKYVVKMLLSLLLLWIYANRLCPPHTIYRHLWVACARAKQMKMLHGWVGRLCVWYWTTNNGLSFRLKMYCTNNEHLFHSIPSHFTRYIYIVAQCYGVAHGNFFAKIHGARMRCRGTQKCNTFL